MIKDKKILVVAGIGFLVVAGMFVLKRPKPVVMPTQERVSSGDIRILNPEEDTKDKKKTDEKFQKLVKWEKEERKIGMKRMPLQIKNGEATLAVEVVTKGTCFPGDADAIEMELKASPNHRLLASVEVLSGKEKTLNWEVPKSFLKEGVAKHEFKLKVAEEPSQFGFFLCTAKSGDDRCGDKPVMDINRIFSEHLSNDEKAGKETRNIFFQYFLLDTRGISVFTGFQRNDKKYDRLKKYAKERRVNNPGFDREIETAKNNIKTLMSYPFSFDGRKLKVELPKYNVAACAGGK